MKRMALTAIALLCSAAASSAAIRKAELTPGLAVDVALVLAVDASSSMDDGERRMQRDGYASALRSQAVMDAIAHGTQHRIAVVFFEWGSSDHQVIVAPWQVVDSPDSAEALAKVIADTPSQDLQRTSISAALDFAGTLLAQSGLKAERQVIDVSGDGPNNDGAVVSIVRDQLVSRGIAINGLPIVNKSPSDFLTMPDLDQYYQHCVIGGEGSFMIPVRGMENFGRALQMKLVIEIAGIKQDRAMVQPAVERDWSNCHIYE